MKRNIITTVVCFLLVAGLAFGGTSYVYAKKIKHKRLSLTCGEKYKLEIKKSKKVKLVSTNKKIAAVKANGTIIAKKAGKCKVKVKKQERTIIYNVTVTEKEVLPVATQAPAVVTELPRPTKDPNLPDTSGGFERGSFVGVITMIQKPADSKYEFNVYTIDINWEETDKLVGKCWILEPNQKTVKVCKYGYDDVKVGDTVKVSTGESYYLIDNCKSVMGLNISK